MPAGYYLDRLYPFIDKVLALVERSGAGFYLTGGTALSRFYLNHRFSDDLDLFVNASIDFRQQAQRVVEALRSGRIEFTIGTSAEAFVQIVAGDAQISLRIDLVNDVAYHYGGFEKASFYNRVDNWRNILSNKIGALSRQEPKDIADILAIACRFPFNWPAVLSEAKQKDLWVEPLEICRIIHDYPLEQLQAIKWARLFDIDRCRAALGALHHDIFYGLDNSLADTGKDFLGRELG